jgi:hypothetical protein
MHPFQVSNDSTRFRSTHVCLSDYGNAFAVLHDQVSDPSRTRVWLRKQIFTIIQADEPRSELPFESAYGSKGSKVLGIGPGQLTELTRELTSPPSSAGQLSS